MAQAPVEIPRLHTARLHLEPMGFQYTQGMFALWSSPEVCEYSGAVSDYERNLLPMPAGSPEVSDKIIDFWVRAAVDGWGFRWAIFESATANLRSRRVKEKMGAELLQTRTASYVDPTFGESELWRLTKLAWQTFRAS